MGPGCCRDGPQHHCHPGHLLDYSRGAQPKRLSGPGRASWGPAQEEVTMPSRDPRQVGLLLLPSKHRAAGQGTKGMAASRVVEPSWAEKGPSHSALWTLTGRRRLIHTQESQLQAPALAGKQPTGTHVDQHQQVHSHSRTVSPVKVQMLRRQVPGFPRAPS